MKRRFLCLLLFICLILHQSCFTASVQKNSDLSPKPAESPCEGTITITDKKGDKVSFTRGEITKDFPSDVPLYPGAEILSTITYKDKHVTTVSLETSDSIDKIKEFYKKELVRNGWKFEGVFSTDKSMMFAGRKDKRTAGIAITSGEKSKNNIAISITEND
ncbi:MAG TPA: hypothetical protein PL110_02425 [Candidatus Eremiobacteraeota bacterium]|nr:MAG: hypothetical protein BWY64_00710 [bacterium ADurb.Bin363]HPZ06943.1 hypothetical protein [Candidatus Eremiobacteraeota bacterium]